MNSKILDDDIVTVQRLNDRVEIIYNSNPNKELKIVRLNKNYYCNPYTFEVHKFKRHSKTREDNLNSLRKTIKRIRNLIDFNVVENECVKWCTLTYKENMQDTKKLYSDFKKFNLRFQYYLNKNFNCSAEYITVAEPQQRGAWHLHVMYIFDKKAPFIPNKEFEKLWSHGFTKVKKLKNSDNLAHYLSAYLTDIKLEKNSNKIVKGGRLYLYPSNFKILRHSKNIKYPKKEKMSYKEAKKLTVDKRLIYAKDYEIDIDFYHANLKLEIYKK